MKESVAFSDGRIICSFPFSRKDKFKEILAGSARWNKTQGTWWCEETLENLQKLSRFYQGEIKLGEHVGFIRRVNGSEIEVSGRFVEYVSTFKGNVQGDDGLLYQNVKLSKLVRLTNENVMKIQAVIRNNYGIKVGPPIEMPIDNLMVHQEDAVNFGYYNWRTYFAHEMGTGKTLTAITLIKILKIKTMIIVNKAYLGSWTGDFEKFYPGMDFCVVDSSTKPKDRMSELMDNDTLIVNYELLHFIAKNEADGPYREMMEAAEGKPLEEIENDLETLENSVRKNPGTKIAGGKIIYTPGTVAYRFKKELDKLKALKKRSKLQAYRAVWEKLGIKMVICDEAQGLRAETPTQKFEAIQTMLDACDVPRRILLSGTPIINGLTDLFRQFIILKDDVMGDNFYRFRSTYYEKVAQWKWEEKPDASERLQTLLRPFMHIVFKRDVLELPDQVFLELSLDMTEKQRNHYRELSNEYMTCFENGEVVEIDSAMTLAGKLQQLSSGFAYDESGEPIWVGSEKYDEMKRVIVESKERKIVIWAYFKATRQKCIEMFEKNGMTYTLDWEEFQSNNGIMIYLGNLASGAAGIQLYKSSFVLYAETSHFAEKFIQSTGRTHRKGTVGSTPPLHTIKGLTGPLPDSKSVTYILMPTSPIERKVSARIREKMAKGDRFVGKDML